MGNAHNFIDRVGHKYGLLSVLEQAPVNKFGRAMWLCRCDCGNEKIVSSSDLSLRRTKSCGCLKKTATAAANVARMKHGHARGHKPSREWRSWKCMIDRCSLPSAPNYHLYGGRGIKICEHWLGHNGFANFFADMGNRPIGHTLDRYPDKDGDYEPGNVRWATDKQQSNNRRETPEYVAIRKATLDAGRAKMWADPEIRARLIAARKRPRKKNVDG